MEILEYHLEETLKLPKNLELLLNSSNFAIFDIETTGLSPRFNNVILIGLLYIKNNHIVIEQFFCNNRKEEIQLLTSFKEKIQQFDLLIDYNGNAFDIPFLNKRFLLNSIDYSIGSYKSIDLLKLIRKVQKNLSIANCKLKSIEQYLGIHRSDQISGKDSVLLYDQFEEQQSKHLKDIILLHNYDDLYYLSKSLIILDSIRYEKILQCFPQVLHIAGGTICYITKQFIKNGSFHLEGFYQNKDIADYIFYENSFDFQYTQKSNTFSIKIPLYKGSLSTGSKCLYIDTHDFPFHYDHKHSKLSIPENIILFKENQDIKIEEIYSFVSILIIHIFRKMKKNTFL
ncbi:ribonuclease H-like domain-containing protein [Marinisporobacter balticus]|uniref:YprB ribonuclease H-like domain-containing protein n=1 Tax=Marinisporobacter balticus TaxID=2018667 RepID=A0A4R2KU26_9FIRM|nr:ribonuclease H-like domain-containing protein [Marinisporobacter balticus]TCO70215.1 hypothetical protein EV214_12752 [Marinisporobacter balticus]